MTRTLIAIGVVAMLLWVAPRSWDPADVRQAEGAAKPVLTRPSPNWNPKAQRPVAAVEVARPVQRPATALEAHQPLDADSLEPVYNDSTSVLRIGATQSVDSISKSVTPRIAMGPLLDVEDTDRFQVQVPLELGPPLAVYAPATIEQHPTNHVGEPLEAE